MRLLKEHPNSCVVIALLTFHTLVAKQCVVLIKLPRDAVPQLQRAVRSVLSPQYDVCSLWHIRRRRRVLPLIALFSRISHRATIIFASNRYFARPLCHRVLSRLRGCELTLC